MTFLNFKLTLDFLGGCFGKNFPLVAKEPKPHVSQEYVPGRGGEGTEQEGTLKLFLIQGKKMQQRKHGPFKWSFKFHPEKSQQMDPLFFAILLQLIDNAVVNQNQSRPQHISTSSRFLSPGVGLQGQGSVVRPLVQGHPQYRKVKGLPTELWVTVRGHHALACRSQGSKAAGPLCATPALGLLCPEGPFPPPLYPLAGQQDF